LTTLSANNVYGLVDMLTATLSQFMPSVTEEEVLGTAEVKQFFPGPRDFDGSFLRSFFAVVFVSTLMRPWNAGMVAGAIVTSGEFTRTANFRLVRNGKTIFECEGLPSMRRFSDEVNKVGKGLEFGASVPFADTRQGDKMVSFVTKQQRKPLEIKL
jgi:translation initiation factor IF-2